MDKVDFKIIRVNPAIGVEFLCKGRKFKVSGITWKDGKRVRVELTEGENTSEIDFEYLIKLIDDNILVWV